MEVTDIMDGILPICTMEGSKPLSSDVDRGFMRTASVSVGLNASFGLPGQR